ncbi:hypothetical protein HK405_000065, partial [Cladochytrium tenue]
MSYAAAAAAASAVSPASSACTPTPTATSPPGLTRPPPKAGRAEREPTASRIPLVDHSSAAAAATERAGSLAQPGRPTAAMAADDGRSRSPSPSHPKHVWTNSRLRRKSDFATEGALSPPHSQVTSPQGPDGRALQPELHVEAAVNEEAEDLVLSRKRRSRIASTPNALTATDSGEPVTPASQNRRGSAAAGAQANSQSKWGSGLGGWAHGPSIWTDTDGPGTSSASKVPTFLGPENVQFRKLSFAGEGGGVGAKDGPGLGYRQPLRGDDGDDADGHARLGATTKPRTRSKSSSSGS